MDLPKLVQGYEHRSFLGQAVNMLVFRTFVFKLNPCFWFFSKNERWRYDEQGKKLPSVYAAFSPAYRVVTLKASACMDSLSFWRRPHTYNKQPFVYSIPKHISYRVCLLYRFLHLPKSYDSKLYMSKNDKGYELNCFWDQTVIICVFIFFLKKKWLSCFWLLGCLNLEFQK